MRKVCFFMALSALTFNTSISAQTDTTRLTRLDNEELNFLYNIYHDTHNPVALSMNKVKTLASATLIGHLERGPLHDVNAFTKSNNFSLDISGLKEIGKFSLSGNIKYKNEKDYDHKWSNTYMVSPLNPFIIGDSVKSDVNTEEFSLHAAASYKFSNSLAAALKLQYVTGSRSDQTDPRPKTNSMHFLINPGAWYKLSDSHNLGLSFDFDIFHSSISHSVVNNLVSNTFFLMKGMGDNYILTTSDSPGYPRDYNGFRFGVNVQWNASLGRFNNLLELGYNTNSEKAKDGGSSYTFKGGDYSYDMLSLYDRLTFGSQRLKHNVILRASYTSDDGYWYAQQRQVDTSHSNLVYFKVLSKDKVHTSKRVNAALCYRIDGLRHDGMLDWSALAGAGISHSDIKHYEASTYNQKYTLGDVHAQGSKFWTLRRMRLETALRAAYRFTLGDPTFSSVRGKLLNEYTAPTFEYATASMFSTGVHAALNIPLKLYHTPTWLTVYANANFKFYSGDNKYSNVYDGDSHTVTELGLNLTL